LIQQLFADKPRTFIRASSAVALKSFSNMKNFLRQESSLPQSFTLRYTNLFNIFREKQKMEKIYFRMQKFNRNFTTYIKEEILYSKDEKFKNNFLLLYFYLNIQNMYTMFINPSWKKIRKFNKHKVFNALSILE